MDRIMEQEKVKKQVIIKIPQPWSYDSHVAVMRTLFSS